MLAVFTEWVVSLKEVASGLGIVKELVVGSERRSIVVLGAVTVLDVLLEVAKGLGFALEEKRFCELEVTSGFTVELADVVGNVLLGLLDILEVVGRFRVVLSNLVSSTHLSHTTRAEIDNSQSIS